MSFCIYIGDGSLIPLYSACYLYSMIADTAFTTVLPSVNRSSAACFLIRIPNMC
jgi:hypothetical protein